MEPVGWAAAAHRAGAAELADPDILLLDEATAALDLRSEAAVNAAADRIVVMDHGGSPRSALTTNS